MNKPIIVGLDPGTTVGVAVLDTEGSIIRLSSKRAENRSEIINYILKFGKPILVASDVNPLPKNIEKISTSLGCKAYFPEVSLSNLEKAKMIKKYKDEIKNSHQKDALAAGIKAFRNYHSLFLKVEEILEKLDRVDLFNKVVERMLRKKNENIVDSVKKILKKEMK